MNDQPETRMAVIDIAPMFFRGTYDEAYDLLVEARNYVEHAVPALRFAAEPPDPVSVTKETMRLTSRLTQIMAWLMAQRAMHEGEIEEEEFGEDRYRLEGQSVCLKRTIDEMDDLPRGLKDLMDRSYRLYTRIQRLDDQFIRSRSADD